jgi:hypothetical protein
MTLPGWNSIETATRLHNFFEFWGIVLFLVVVGFEFLAYFYGHRKDWLVEEAARVAAGEQQHADAETQRRHEADTATIREELARAQKDAETARQEAADAGRKAASLETKAAQRRLSDSQIRILRDALKPFAGQKATIAITLGDHESHVLASQFVSVFREAGWDVGGGDGVSQAVYSGPPTYGIQVTVNEQDARAGKLPTGAEKLIRALSGLGLTKQGYANPQIPSGSIEFRVGPKEP